MSKVMATNIYFDNPVDGTMDCTQFDTTDERELMELWWDFCRENGIITAVEEEEVEAD